MSRILITGGAGYVGSLLTSVLVGDGHRVSVYDTCWFGKRLPSVVLHQKDIRDIEAFKAAVEGIETVIHLACISNDASFKLNEKLSTAINYDAFEPLVIASKEAKVKRFIYASSSSVYGVSDAPDVKEDHPLVPLTLYSQCKALCEPILLAHQSAEFTCIIVRPATLCGYSPRMRFDLMVNSFVNQAVRKGEIFVMGGEQKRANLHIRDMVRCYQALLKADANLVGGQIFNVNCANKTIMQIAEIVAAMTGARITLKESNDGRSYHINADKIHRVLGFETAYKVGDAVVEIMRRFHTGEWPDSAYNPIYMNTDQYLVSHVA